MTFPSQHHLQFFDRMAPIRHDNEIVVILTGHLFIEELLVASVKKGVPNPDKLNCRSFYDFLCLARALGKPELSEDLMNAAEALNRLRNQLAHNLDQEKYFVCRQSFLSCINTRFSDTLLSEFGEMWLSIMSLHARFISALEWDPASLCLPTLLTMPIEKAK